MHRIIHKFTITMYGIDRGDEVEGNISLYKEDVLKKLVYEPGALT